MWKEPGVEATWLEALTVSEEEKRTKSEDYCGEDKGK